MRRSRRRGKLLQGSRKMKTRHKSIQPERRSNSTRPKAPEQKAKDSPEMDVYHDDNRRNMYDPEVGEALKRDNTKKKNGQRE